MIKDKELGLVVAENDTEVGWFNMADHCRHTIKILKARDIKAKKELKMTAREIEQKFKAGLKASVKQNAIELHVQKELLKFAESKLKTK